MSTDTLESAVEKMLIPMESDTPETDIEDSSDELRDEETQVEDETEEEVDEDLVDDEEEESYDPDSPEDTDESDESDDEPGQDAPETFTVKVDGEEVSVTLEDLKRSYSGQGKIQKGMQEAAEVRKQAEALREQQAQMFQYLQQTIQQVQQEGVMAPPQPPSSELLQTDPIGYMEARAKYEEDVGRFQQQHQQLSQLAQYQQAQQQEQETQHLRNEMVKLREVVPEFANPESGAKLKQDLLSYGQENGYSVEELSSVSDHRALALLVKAMKYDKMQAGKANIESKVRKAKPVVKAGAKKVADPKGQRRAKQQTKLKRTGRIEDAVSLLLDN